MKNPATLIVSLIGILVVTSMAVFAVDEREHAIVFRLGEIVSVKNSPGLYFKVPLLDNVRYFEKRIVTLDWGEPDRFITSEKKNMLVDSYVKWRIIEPSQYYVSVRGDERQAEERLSQVVNDGLRAEFGKRTIHEVISGERAKIMEILRVKADNEARQMGIEVLDVRLKRVDLPQEVSESVYRRMEAERKRVANDLRSQGAGAAEKIRADADKQREVILAEAYRDAQRIKGEGDARATEIYALAHQKNPEFYSFYRSLEAYRNSFNNKSDILVLDPSSEFFNYLKDSGGYK